MSVLRYCPHVNANARDKTSQRQNPEDPAKRTGQPLLQSSRLILEMEVDEDGDRDNREVDSQAEP